MTQFNAVQCRIGRVLLDWSQAKLAQAAEIGLATVKRFEAGAEVTPVMVTAMKRALQDAGVVYLEAGSEWQGTRIKIGVILPEGKPARI